MSLEENLTLSQADQFLEKQTYRRIKKIDI